jgi:hypothetical protein
MCSASFGHVHPPVLSVVQDSAQLCFARACLQVEPAAVEGDFCGLVLHVGHAAGEYGQANALLESVRVVLWSGWSLRQLNLYPRLPTCSHLRRGSRYRHHRMGLRGSPWIVPRSTWERDAGLLRPRSVPNPRSYMMANRSSWCRVPKALLKSHSMAYSCPPPARASSHAITIISTWFSVLQAEGGGQRRLHRGCLEAEWRQNGC